MIKVKLSSVCQCVPRTDFTRVEGTYFILDKLFKLAILLMVPT